MSRQASRKYQSHAELLGKVAYMCNIVRYRQPEQMLSISFDYDSILQGLAKITPETSSTYGV